MIRLAVWADHKSCWRIKSGSPQSSLAVGSIKCSQTSWWITMLTYFLDKTQWIHTSRWHGTSNHQTGNFTLNLNEFGLGPFQLFFQPLWHRFLNKMRYLIWNEDFGPLSNSPVLYLFNLSNIINFGSGSWVASQCNSSSPGHGCICLVALQPLTTCESPWNLIYFALQPLEEF